MSQESAGASFRCDAAASLRKRSGVPKCANFSAAVPSLQELRCCETGPRWPTHDNTITLHRIVQKRFIIIYGYDNLESAGHSSRGAMHAGKVSFLDLIW